MSERPTIDEILARRKPRTDSVRIPIDTEILTAIADLEQRIDAQQRLDEMEHTAPKAPELAAELAALEAQADLVSAEFTFQELPRPDFRALVEAHGPEKGSSARWNEETFAPALIAACCVDPVMTIEQAETVWSTWSEAATFLLFSKAWDVNEGKVKVPFFARSTGKTPASP